jgi:hypothetical protein
LTVERCINGRIDGLDDIATTGLTQTEDVQTTVPEESKTNVAETTEINIPGETETDSPQTTAVDVPEETETDLPDNTDTPPDVKTTNGGIELPTLSTIRTWTWANTSFTAPPNAETTRINTSADVISSTDVEEESTTAAEDLDTSTSLEPTTTTTTAETTTTTEAIITITNVARNGRFAEGSAGNGDIPGFDHEGGVERTEGTCYQDDGSPDNACVVFATSGAARKREPLPNSGKITQQLTGLVSGDTYTVQFYYYIADLGGDGSSCELRVDAGIFGVDRIDLLSETRVWRKAVASVESDFTEASLSIYIDCSNDIFIRVFVDSLFVTNKATEDNINEFELDYRESEPEPGNGGGNGNGNGNGQGEF